MADKLRLAFYWAASCGGCEVAVLDIHERILDVAALADIVFWPVALDFKYHHVQALPDKAIDVCLFNGAIRNSEQEEVARLLRAKSKVLVAFGSCACFGGIPGLANLHDREEVFQRVYRETPSTVNPDGTAPQTVTPTEVGELRLPDFYDTVLTLAQVVPVEFFAPGCPPPPELVLKVVDALATGTLPPAGSVIASDRSLCEECDRVKEQKRINRLYRPFEVLPDPCRCLLEQGLLCMGPATRGGCGARCIKANFPCRGCFGPLPGVQDQGAKMLSALASIFGEKGEADSRRLVEEVVDPVGYFYRFTLPNSIIYRRRRVAAEVKAGTA